MQPVVSNGLGSKMVVRSDVGSIESNTVVFFPFLDKLSYEILIQYYDRSEKTNRELGELLKRCQKHWKDIEEYGGKP